MALTVVAVFMSLFHLYAAYAIVPAHILRTTHVTMVLVFIFLTFPIAARFKNRLMVWDVGFAMLAVATLAYAVMGGDDFSDRNTFPLTIDIVFGSILILLILEALRRTNGWVLLTVTVSFLLYALFGNHLPAPWTHKGYELSRLVGFMYMTLEGIFGTAVDVSSTLIILFTIFGAFLQFSGAGKFFIDFSFSIDVSPFRLIDAFAELTYVPSPTNAPGHVVQSSDGATFSSANHAAGGCWVATIGRSKRRANSKSR